MKKLLFAIAATLLAASVQAAPFAYADGPNSTMLLYHQKCPVEGAGKWQFGLVVYTNGVKLNGCWEKYVSAEFKSETIALCILEEKVPGKKTFAPGCMYGSASNFIKGNPIPQRAF